MTAAEAIAAQRAIVGGEADPFASEWDALPEAERAFWLQVSRQSTHYAKPPWRDVPGSIRCTIKANLYRAASRASLLLKAGAAA